MPEMVEVQIDSVRVSLMSPQRVVILRQKDTERYLPIWVGPYEAESITIALQEVEMSRPLTHDLLKNVFTVFDGKILRVEIVALREDIFYGNIVTETGSKITNVDSRPSDAIALALRAHVPILVSLDVMNEAGILPEKDIQDETPAPPAHQETKPLPAPSKESEDRLSVFEDFLTALDDKKKGDGGEGEAGDEGGEEKPKKKPKK
jgi:bifunctional DNase/RNase